MRSHVRLLPVVLIVFALLTLVATACPASTACDDFPINRAEMAYLLASGMAGGPESVPPGPVSQTFSDVSTDFWASDYVEYLAHARIITGDPDGRYHPEYLADRAETAVYLARAVAGGEEFVPTGPATPSFSDVSADHWTYRYVEYLYARGVGIAYQTSPMLFRPADLMSAYTLVAWINQGLGVAIDPCGTPHPTLNAGLWATPQSGTPPLTVQFTSLQSVRDPVLCPPCVARSLLWNFGDGTTSTEVAPSHEYVTLGRYTVSLTASNTFANRTATATDLILVHGPPPLAYFLGVPITGTAPFTVQFTDLSLDSDPTAWSWTFGDKGTSITRNPSHDYLTPGRFTVTLTASNIAGRSTYIREQYILATFPDVATNYWALDSILACTTAGIVQGYPDGTYDPAMVVTRDQMAVYISRALAGNDDKVPTASPIPYFPDVPADYWAYDYVEYAQYLGIVQGYSDGYHPMEPVDRGQMAVYIARAVAGGDVNILDGSATATFDDVPTTFWAYKYIEYIADPARAITQGYPDGLYHPEYPCARDQMAVYVQRAFNLP